MSKKEQIHYREHGVYRCKHCGEPWHDEKDLKRHIQHWHSNSKRAKQWRARH